MMCFARLRLLLACLVIGAVWFLAPPPTFAGTCSVLCRGSVTPQRFEIGRRADCLNLCPHICAYPPDSWVGVIRGGEGRCEGPATFSGTEAPPPPSVVDGTCEAVCGDGYLRETLYFNEPDRIHNTQECATRCQTACDAHSSSLGFPFVCMESAYHAPRASESSSDTNNLDCPWYEQDGPEDGSGPVTCQPSSGRNSNTKGTAARRTPPRTTASSGNCEFNGVHDPFCGKSISEIVGTIVRFLLGAAGALFLAMFVYGGAVWLTAGDSGRHEEAQKTLLNATAGILIVIASYTIVSLLVRFVGGLGISQSNEGPRLEEETTQETSAPAPATESSPTPTSTPTPVRCEDMDFAPICAEACSSSPLGADTCRTVCYSVYMGACAPTFTVESCRSRCPSDCASVRGVFTCTTVECPRLCSVWASAVPRTR